MNTSIPPLPGEHIAPAPVQTPSSWKKKLMIVGCVVLGITGVSAASAAWWYQYNFNASAFKPVQLSLAEKQEVEQKMAALVEQAEPTDPAKTIVLNEREINGYLEQQGYGESIKININKDGLGATILAPVADDVPMFGGRTLRLKVAFNTQLDDNKKFALSLADVSVGGISLPNAWLGNVKGLNLLDNAQHDQGFVKAFAAGIKSLQMKSGEMRLVLND